MNKPKPRIDDKGVPWCTEDCPWCYGAPDGLDSGRTCTFLGDETQHPYVEPDELDEMNSICPHAVEALAAVVGQLPKDGDGKPAVLGDELYRAITGENITKAITPNERTRT